MSPWRPVELAGWAAQIVAIFLLLRTRNRGPARNVPPQPTLVVCALVISVAWAWRLAYQFVLASNEFWYYVADDPCRWLLSWSWAQKPYVLTWDGVWQGATFYLHGLAMRLGGDALVASTFVSATYPLLSLLGIFVFTAALYRDRALAAASAAFLAPWWLHIFLGTGTMTELPVLAFLFTGGGLLFVALRSDGRRRRTMFFLSAASFAVATAFHMIAWMALAGILLVLLVYAITKGKENRFGPAQWLLFALGATAYCWIWVIGCWIKFGHPLAFVANYAETTRVMIATMSLTERLRAYPEALVWSVQGFLPLAAYGLYEGLGRPSEERSRIRASIAAAAMFLLILVAASTRNPGGPPHRQTLWLAAFLVPIALAPLRRLLSAWRAGSQSADSGADRRSTVRVGLIAFVLVSWFLGNHLKVAALQRTVNILDSEAIALGTWLRQEFIRPQALSPIPPNMPVRLWLREPSLYTELAIQYSFGRPDLLQVWKEADPGIGSLQPGQYVVSERPVSDAKVVEKTRFGRFTVYRAGESAIAERAPP